MMKTYKNILQIALPAMAENFLQFLMGMIDSYLVAHLGLVVISGVSVANNIMAIYQAIFIAIGAAASALLSRSIGEKRRDKVSNQATEAVKITLVISLLLGLLAVVAGQAVLALLGTEKAVAQAGGQYLAVVGGGVLLLGLLTTFGAILRSMGLTRVPMYVSLLSNVLNAVFSAVAVFVFQAGIIGVAVGTLLARLIACIILWKCLPVQLEKPTWKLDKELLSLAFLAAGERLMMRAGDVMIVAIIVTLGTSVVAGNAIGETLTQFNYMPGMGVATATVILVAQAHGTGNRNRVRELIRASFQMALLPMFLLSGLVFLFGTPLTQLYTHDAEALSASLVVILYAFLGTPMAAGTLIYTAAWQGIGNARLPFYATTLGMWVIRIGVGYLLTVVCGWGMAGVWIATLLDNLFRWLLLSIVFGGYSTKKI